MDPRHPPHQDRSMSAVLAAAVGLCLLAGAVAIAAIVAAPARLAILAAVATVAIAACLIAASVVGHRTSHPRRAHGTPASPDHNDRSE